MKPKKIKKHFWLFVLLFGVLFTIPGNSEDLKDKPDSIRYVMGVNVDGTVLDEFPGKDILEFTLYTMEQQSSIVWKTAKGYFIYSLSGDDHELKAYQLLEVLRKNGLKTFVAQRKGTSLKFNEYHRVVAIQVAARKTGN